MAARGASLLGKRALVVGLLNKHSLAASVTHALLAHGASCVVAARSPLSESQIKACAFELPFAPHGHQHTDAGAATQSLHFADCDVESDASIGALMEQCARAFDGELDILVHSVAFAPRETFQARGTLHATRGAWNQALDVSAYSLIALTRAALPMLSAGEARDRSVMALSYAGANKIMPNYNVMGPAKAALEATSRQLAYDLGDEGIRVNCLSPGPMNTVSARGIPGISKMRKYAEEHSPLRRNASGADVGELAAFLAGDGAAAITGQTFYGMQLAIYAQVGDRIEFSISSDGVPTATIEGRVMDVDAAHPLKCAVQVSTFEPFRQVDLSEATYKIVYAAGDITRLKPEMIGWPIEIPLDEKLPRAPAECGVIKQVDCGLNCALIAFDDGRKDWRDLSLNAFKVVGRQSSTSSPTKVASSKSEHIAVANIPRLHTDANPPVHVVQAELPSIEADDFEWYTEGGHVELCDSGGNFLEGALLCSLRDKTVQLYNEQRQFFEIQMPKQSFKVVIHGLMTVKSVPLGQAVEIYSPMHAEFRRGFVLKAAVLGRLTPVKFEDVGLEWLDLTSQTFKLVFLAPTTVKNVANGSAEVIKPSAPLTQPENQAQVKGSQGMPETRSVSVANNRGNGGSPAASTMHVPQANDREHQHERTKQQQAKKPISTTLPVLAVGHVIELWESTTKQFMKHRVARVVSPAQPHVYELELVLGSGSNLSMSATRAPETEKRVIIDLTAVKARYQLSVDDWELYEPILRGHRVDVYDKVDRSVLSGKLVDSSHKGEDSTIDPRVYVKLKDGSKRWFSVKQTKIKLKLAGEPGVSQADPALPAVEPLVSPDSMWQRVDPPLLEGKIVPMTDEENSILARQQSEKLHHEVQESSQLARHASTPSMAKGSSQKPSRVPSLDFSALVRERAEPVIQPAPTSESMKADVFDESQRSTGSAGDALSDLLPAMDDLWFEEPTLTGTNTVMRYVNVGTGEVSHDMPQWLKKTDDTTGDSFILNTTTGVRFQSPGSSTSNTATPQSSERAPVVVTLPIGPLEAVRVASQINAAPSSVDLCAEAFGP